METFEPQSLLNETTDQWSNPVRAQALEIAIAVVKQAWLIVETELQAQGYGGDALDFEGISRYDY